MDSSQIWGKACKCRCVFTAGYADVCQNYSLKVLPQDLPYRGCKYCCRAHERLHVFNTDIDDMIPLSQIPESLPISTENGVDDIYLHDHQIREGKYSARPSE